MNLKLLLCLAALAAAAVANAATDTDAGWSVETASRDNYNGVTLANGRIGLVSGKSLFEVSDIVLNGIYDRESTNPESVSRIVRAPLFTNLTMAVDGHELTDGDVSDWHQRLDMRRAVMQTGFSVPQAQVTYSIRALRNMPYMGLIEVEVTPLRDFDLTVTNTPVFPSELLDTKAYYTYMDGDGKPMAVMMTDAWSNTRRQHLTTAASFLFDGERPVVDASPGDPDMSFSKKLTKGRKFRFWLAGAVTSGHEFSFPANEAHRMVVTAMLNGPETVTARHEAEWDRLWQGDIEIEGDPEAQRDVRLALYNLYSFAGEDTRLSLPPMGLSTVSGYNGHIFWDTEIWMYPVLLMLNREMARSCVDYRIDRMPKACQRARQFGLDGAMYPWESDDTGEEATPTWCLTGTFEIHITADVALALWNYYRVTGDLEWLKTEAWPVMKETADYWVSRSTPNADGTYSILNVVGADEYIANIDDNAFTNGAAKRALEYTARAAEITGNIPDPRWLEVAKGLKFHYMPDGTMLENATYHGQTIKQADVNLLAYPLGLVSDPARVRQDLEYYAKKIDPDGPAMGNCILSVLYSQLGEPRQAYHYFRKTYEPHKRPPFGVLSESASSNNPYFATGAGGLIQAVVNGFGGLRITDSGIVQLPTRLPERWKSLTIKGVGPDKRTYTVTAH